MRTVLVLGVPRSGTTWVGQSLARCRAAGYVHEPDGVHEPFAFHARRVDGLANHAILAPGDRAPEFERLWDGVAAGGKPDHSVRDVVSRRLFQRTSADAKMKARTGGGMSPLLAIADRFAMPRGADPGIDYVVAKSVNAALSAEWIYDRWHPAMLVVHRDHRNVLSSWLAMGMMGPRPDVFSAIVDHAQTRWGVALDHDDRPFARAVATCVVMMLALYDALRRHDDWLALSHEAACLDPATRLSEVARGLGLEWTDSAEEFVKASNRPGDGYATQRVAGDLPDQWKSRLSPEQIEVVDDVCARFPDELWTVPDSPRPAPGLNG